MDCPDANILQALRDGELPASDREAMLDHADSCEDCRQLLAALARTLPAPSDGGVPAPTPATSAPPLSLLVKGTVVGRYEVESFLGAGGLGLVYAALDPELSRRVALKLLKVGAAAAEAQPQLMREARAMARISHPNALTVLDVGVWRDRVYVVIELVDGGDLRAWLEARPRGIAEIVDVFRAAGQGLAAAHAAGLVHRDFKPDNVLVSGDGRVRVTDFGFAHAAEGDAVGEGGTPAYMSPEQHDGGHVDGRSDQFAFCVALYEAIYGERPFAGEDIRSLRAAVLGGAVRPPPRGSAVPATLRRILVRGLARQPGDRWPTMESLLGALGRDRAKVPRRVAIAAAAVLAVVATAAAGDWILRARLHAAAHAAFAATRAQVSHALALRHEAFSTLADLSLQLPILREVAGTRDLADLGLGSRERDARDLATLHASLRDADWNAWASSADRGNLAVADYKGRLLYATASPDAFGNDMRALRAVAAVHQSGGSALQVIRAGDAAVRTTGLAPPRDGLLLVFARASVSGSVPQAIFIQAIDARRFLADLTPGSDVRLSLAAPDGAAEGEVPPRLVSLQSADEAWSDGTEWLLHAVPLEGAAGRVVMARRADAGLAGLFPYARAVLACLGGAALAVLLGALWTVRTVARERRTVSVRLSPPRFSHE